MHPPVHAVTPRGPTFFFSLPQGPDSLWVPPPYCPRNNADYVIGLKQPKRDSDHSFPADTRINNAQEL